MELRKFVLAAALGTTVLTTVPALIAPQEAAASCWSQYYSDCEPDYPTDPGGGGDDGGGGDTGGGGGDDGGGDDGGSDTGGDTGGDWGGGGDTGGGDSGTGNDWGDGGGDWGSDGGAGTTWDPGPDFTDLSTGNIGDWFSPEIPTVVITAPRQEFDRSLYQGSGGSDYLRTDGTGGTGGSGSGTMPGAWIIGRGQTWFERQNCYTNPSQASTKITDGISYQVNYKVSANVTAKASELLSANLGAELNKQLNRTHTLEITLGPGQSWALDVQYETVAYQITTTWLGGYTVEYVNVTKPTGHVSFSSCQ
ncbi:DUF6426 family protein [Kitasatospora albolonga]|uniref:DUF6426 family protein n=1 Tax=Kitasatospora albolonga TaxID=68173 RepID=UPI0035E77BF4